MLFKLFESVAQLTIHDQVVKEAASQKAAPGRKQRQAQPVSKEEAADGRIDYARVSMSVLLRKIITTCFIQCTGP